MRRLLFTLLITLLSVCAYAQDPLPSWNDTSAKHSIMTFVQASAQPSNPAFIPVAQRIAVFDMDGTLMVEKPVPAALVPILAELKDSVERHPELKGKPAIAALLNGDLKAVQATGKQGLSDIIAAITVDRTTDDVSTDMQRLAGVAKNSHYNKPYIQLIYAPMVELLDYLRANGFQVWIASGSPVAFTRAFSQSDFGVPPQQVIGSTLETRFTEKNGRAVLVYTGKIGHIDDQEGKPPAIFLSIGVRPAFVAGNVGGAGDIAMMRYSKDRQGPSFQLLINHDDAEREFSYGEKNGYSLDAAKRFGFAVVSMKNDWSKIFLPSLPKVAPDPSAP
jgi:phosphoserine phosphatase